MPKDRRGEHVIRRHAMTVQDQADIMFASRRWSMGRNWCWNNGWWDKNVADADEGKEPMEPMKTDETPEASYP
jgi:hypothetical protein